MSLTAKQAKFVEEYLIDLNATQAATRAGYSARTAFRIGAENMQKPVIRAAIAAKQAERSQRTQITADSVLAELHDLHMKSLREIHDREGNTLMESPSVAAKCLDMKMRHLGLYDADKSQKTEITLNGFRMVQQ